MEFEFKAEVNTSLVMDTQQANHPSYVGHQIHSIENIVTHLRRDKQRGLSLICPDLSVGSR